MSSAQPGQSSTTSARSRHSARMIAQTSIDAKLHADFEESGGTSFDYSASVRVTNDPIRGGDRPPSSSKVTTAYLHQIQKGKLIQPFGCLLVLDEKTFKVIAYSENAPEMLTTVTHAVPIVGDHPFLDIGSDIRSIFTAPSSSALQKALGFGEVSLLNPVLVHCKTSGKPFYAIIHRVTGGLIIDFEPVKPYEVPMTAAGALQSYKLAAKAIARLQSLPSGSMERLCDAMAQEVFELTGYDRVMVYKFHEDDHGEVLAEITKTGLDPYLGLHYPATDIPQAARFLFMKNKVRMICDCRANHVKVVQDKNLDFDLTLCGSTLRAPHSCHLQYMENMNSIASLVMSVVVNEGEEEEAGPANSSSSNLEKRKRLWGLVVCHNTSPRFVPFPLRYACEFLAQVFAIHVSKELELENQNLEKNILRTQTLLCDLLLRDAPLGIVSQSPNVTDLVKCDGAVLLYKNKTYKLGLTPNDFQIRDIVSWLDEYHIDSTGLSTDSLYDAGFPGALSLGDAICGTAAVRITERDWLFWFRAHTAAEIRWGGAKHEAGEKDDGRKMHPRSSFNAFLEVVKSRSLPWKDFEMDAIHSLQLILRNSFLKEGGEGDLVRTRLSEMQMIEGVQELEAVTSEMVRLIETATVPILAVDVDGLVNGWNSKIAELTGLSVESAIGRHFLELVEDSSAGVVSRMLELAIQGKEEQNVQFEIKTHDQTTESAPPITLVVNACASKDVKENIVGVCFIAQDITAQKTIMDKFTRIQGDYKSIIQNPNPLIPPIFGSDEFGWCSEWNPAMTKISGWRKDDVINKMLVGEIFGTNKSNYCRIKNQEAYVNLGIALNNAVTGQHSEKMPFGFLSRGGKYVECLLCVSKKMDPEGSVTGVFCFLQLASPELQRALHVQRLSEENALKRSRVLAYIRREIRNPLSGIIFSRKMMEGTDLDDEQKNLLRTSGHCQRQLNKILDDTDLDHIIEGYLDLEMVEFNLHEVLIASISQVIMKSNGKGIVIADNLAQNLSNETLYGDSLRLQQVLAAFLLISVTSTPSGGSVGVAAKLTKDSIGQSVQLGHLEFRITHSGGGVAQQVLDQMFGGDEAEASDEGISLFISRKLVKLMNGDVQYLREAGKSTFIISVELAISNNN
ncbi:hypothetical protein ABFX02_14G085300 [Erythranthe guttata]